MSALKSIPALTVSSVILAACVTPGIDYTAEVAPGNPDAATYRTVAVDRFRGPLGDWYADEFQAMLQSAAFNGAPWFQVGIFSGQSNVEGVYDGALDVGYPYVSERYYTDSQCVKREEVDGEKKCVKKVDIEYVCLRYSVDVSVRPRLIDKTDGTIIHQSEYLGSDSEEECFETGYVQYRIRRGSDDPGRGKFRYAYEDYGNPGYRLGGDYIIDRITASALRQTLWQARRDIAPYNQDVRATILTEAQDFEVRADPRFESAVAAVRNSDPGTACGLFTELAARYPSAPAVLHNLGACAEALGDKDRAQTLYAEAAAGFRTLGIEPTDRVLSALQRISSLKSDEVILDELVPAVGDPES
ncbi:MAG: hypothetical protein AAFV54_07780 [Pseudomonadota bacterium]